MSQEKAGGNSSIAQIIPPSQNLWDTFYEPWYDKILAHEETSGERPIVGTAYLGGDQQDVAGFMIPAEGPTQVIRTRLWGQTFDVSHQYLKDVPEVARITHDAHAMLVLGYDLSEDQTGLSIAVNDQLRHLPWAQEDAPEEQPETVAAYLKTAESVGALLSRIDVQEQFIQLDAYVVGTLLESAAVEKPIDSEFRTD